MYEDGKYRELFDPPTLEWHVTDADEATAEMLPITEGILTQVLGGRPEAERRLQGHAPSATHNADASTPQGRLFMPPRKLRCQIM